MEVPDDVHRNDDWPPGSQEARARRFAAYGRTKRDYVECALLCVLAIFLPPASVACVTGCDGNFALCLILTILGMWGAGFIHALFVIFYYGGYVTMNTTRRQKRREKRRQRELSLVPPPVNPVSMPEPVIPHDPTSLGGKDHQDYYAQDTNAAERYYPQDAYATGAEHRPNEEYARDDAWDEGPPKSRPGFRRESEGGLFYS